MFLWAQSVDNIRTLTAPTKARGHVGAQESRVLMYVACELPIVYEAPSDFYDYMLLSSSPRIERRMLWDAEDPFVARRICVAIEPLTVTFKANEKEK